MSGTDDNGGSGSTGFEQSVTDSDSKCRLVINVPKWDGASAVSYLRLGSVPNDVATKPEPGDTLAKLVQTTQDTSGKYTADAFIDDGRDRDGSGTTTTGDNSGSLAKFTTVQNRRDESKKLHTKGGWRDHSDGNRITTTSGDKVEVIQGNYKLIVLGRQRVGTTAADAANMMSNADALDISGGHTVDANAAPGSISEIKWVQDPWSGTWKVTEETEKGDTKTVFHGNTEEIFYGNSVTSTVGSEHPDQNITDFLSDPSCTQKKLNPTVVEKTWASSITSNTGSSETWVPTITETTYVTTETSEKHCTTTTELLWAGAQLTRNSCGFIAEATACGLKIEAYIGPVIEAYMGLKLELELAAKVEIHAGVFLEISIGQKYEIGLDDSFVLEGGKFEAALEHTDLKAMQTKINGSTTQVAGTQTTVSASDTKLASMKTALSGLDQTTATAKDVIAAMVNIL